MKKGIKKTVLWIIGSLLALILVIAVLINIFGDAALKAGVETGASNAMKVDVAVRDISLKILAGELRINDLVVNNPEGYQNPTFLEMGNAFVALNTSSLLSDTVEINTLQLDNVHLTIEQKGLKSNLSEILDNLPKAEESAESAEEKPGKDLLIKNLDLNEIKVTIKLLPVPGRADNLSLTLNPIHMENVGSGEHMDTQRLVSTIIMAIAGGIAKKGVGTLPTEMVTNITGELTDQGMKILQGGAGIGGGIIEGGQDAAEQATETLRSLIPFQGNNQEEDEEEGE